jgi:hypothetical protein
MHPPPPEAVRALGAPAAGRAWAPVAPGFSGARVWRGTAAGALPIALRQWPAGTAPERVGRVHRWLARAAHLAFVPRPRAAALVSGRAFEVCDWLPGAPVPAPSGAQVASACEALAELHAAWADERAFAPCPAVLRRLQALRAPLPVARAPLLERARGAVAARVPALVRALDPWERRPVPVHPCVRDPRAADVLFVGDRVSGLVDYGAADTDSPAADLARYLADATADAERFEDGLRAYRGPDAPPELVRALARTGAACSLLGWLVRLAGRAAPLTAAEAGRVADLLARLPPEADERC